MLPLLLPPCQTGLGPGTQQTPDQVPVEGRLGTFPDPTPVSLAQSWQRLLDFQDLGCASHSNKLMFPSLLTHRQEHQGPRNGCPPPPAKEPLLAK